MTTPEQRMAALEASHRELMEACRACIEMFGESDPDDDWTAIQKARKAYANARRLQEPPHDQ